MNHQTENAVPAAPITTRPEHPDDGPAVRAVAEAAFGAVAEADLIDTLRAACPDLVSLVAETTRDGIVGHILLSPITIDDVPAGMGLAPVSVHPAHQHRGVGSSLIQAGLAILDARACPLVVLLGHADYYPRFGFTPATPLGLRCPWPVPESVFMARVRPGGPPPPPGLVRYRPEFDTLL